MTCSTTDQLVQPSRWQPARQIESGEQPGVWTPQGLSWGGQLTAMVITRDRTMFVGSDVGGVHRSNDGGASWQCTSQGLGNCYISSLLWLEEDQVLLAGSLGGLYCSVDLAGHWAPIRNGFPAPSPWAHSAPVECLAVDADSPDILYCGLGRVTSDVLPPAQIYCSLDKGRSWKGLAPLPAGDFPTVMALACRGAELYAATSAGVFKSSDAGTSWKALGPLPETGVNSILVHPHQPGLLHVAVYATPGTSPWRGGVWSSSDDGLTWQHSSRGLEARVGAKEAFLDTSQYRCLLRAPGDPETLYVANISWGSAGAFRSSDGGMTWKDLNKKLRYSRALGWLDFWSIGSFPLYLDPWRPGEVYMGGPCLYSPNGGNKWSQRYCSPVLDNTWTGIGLNVTCLYDVAFDPGNADIRYAAFWDIGFLYSQDRGRTWERRVNGLQYEGNMFHLETDPDRPGWIWASTGRWENPAGQLNLSRDYGVRWEPLGSPGQGLPDKAIYGFQVIVSPGAPDRIIALSHGKGPYLSLDAGLSWQPARSCMGPGELRYGRTVRCDPADTTMLYAAAEALDGTPGGVWRSIDGGWNWIRLPLAVSDAKDVLVDPHDPKTILVAARACWDAATWHLQPGGVYRSRDAGQTWNHVFECEFAMTLEADPGVPGRFYVGTVDHPHHDIMSQQGILRSDDWGHTWCQVNQGLGLLSVSTIAVDPRDSGHLLLGTGGNGLYEVRDIDRQLQP